MTRDDIIAEVAANPDDDAPRLRAADWFERQGGDENRGRAEFIRVQLERARLPADDPQQSQLRVRELTLLKQHVPAWQAAHFGLKKCIFRRGFVEYVHLHLKHYLHHRRQLHRFEPIRDIRLTGWHRASDSLVERVANCEELSRLQALRIHNRGAHQTVRGHLLRLLESPHLANLETFHGCRATFTPEERRRFERLPLLARLEELSLPYLDPIPIRPGKWLEDADDLMDWPRLRSLRLPMLPSLPAFARQPFWSRLESLALHGADLGFPTFPSTSLTPASVADMLPRSITDLTLISNSISPEMREEDARPLFDRLASLKLSSLSTWGVPLPPEGLAQVLARDSKCRLTDLTLSSHCGGPQLDAICRSAVPGRLRSLRLIGDNVDKSTADAFLRSDCLAGLRQLDLCDILLDAGSLSQLAATSPMLQILRVADCGLTAQAIGEAIGSGAFAHLNWLEVGRQGHGRPVEAQTMTTQVARMLGRSPALVGLAFKSRPPDVEAVRQALLAETPVRWGAIEDYREGDNASYRRTFAPEYWPPTDEGYAALQRWLEG